MEWLHRYRESDHGPVIRNAFKACRAVAYHQCGSIQLLHSVLEDFAKGTFEATVSKAHRLCWPGRLYLDENHTVIKDDEPVNAEVRFLRTVSNLGKHDRIREKLKLTTDVSFKQITEISGESASPTLYSGIVDTQWACLAQDICRYRNEQPVGYTRHCWLA